MLRLLYGTAAGRLLLRPLTSRALSRLIGRFMDSRVSRPLIGPFVRKNRIDLSDYLPEAYASFNAFFTRRVRPERRPFDSRPESLCAPCDGLLSVYPIGEDCSFVIKHSRYTPASLLGNDPRAEAFRGGMALVFRLCVHHYHRYRYFDSGVKGENRFIPGVLHTVRPVALEQTDVFIQNCREYTLLETDHFGTAAQVEVGAMLVGKIRNLDGACRFERGQEKGMFLYGGSTVVLLLQKGAAELPKTLLEATARGQETPVQCGQVIGQATQPQFTRIFPSSGEKST